MPPTPYQMLAARLDALPNGFPATASGVELDVLARLFTPEEATCAAALRLTAQTPDELAAALDADPKALRAMLKGLARRGLIAVERTARGLGYALMPFVVGFYEMQLPRLDAELARLIEAYMHEAFGDVLNVEPALHRVIPVREAVAVDLEIQPFESAAAILGRAQAWGVVECICRKQKTLVGEPCQHPLDVCLVFSHTPNAYDRTSVVQALDYEGALGVLRRAADAGLVHTLNNHQGDEGYICNCCTCSCGILRGVAELGLSNVVARSTFVCEGAAEACTGCEACVGRCQFDALALDDGVIAIDRRRCVGCGQCSLGCDQGALALVRRPNDEIKPIPASMRDWQLQRAAARGQNFEDVL